MTTILHETEKLGQQIWLDNLSRSLIVSGELEKYVEAGICGITSNPAIFLQSIKNDPLYQADVVKLKTQDLTPKTRYEQLVIADIQAACDKFLPLYKSSQADKGYVSLEIDPELAQNPEGSVEEGVRLWSAINRPNLMIKVPATLAGLFVITELISQGINVNVTLIFSQDTSLKTLEAYAAGLDIRNKNGESIKNIRLVASFFMSRIDATLDDTLPSELQGKTAISVAKLAYLDWQNFCENSMFHNLEQSGALKPSLLWASTGRKNPAYPDTYYVDNLIAPHTVNTVPEKTLHSFLDHGQAKASLTSNTEEASSTITQLEQQGISLVQLAQKLQGEGLVQFEQAFEALLNLLE